MGTGVMLPGYQLNLGTGELAIGIVHCPFIPEYQLWVRESCCRGISFNLGTGVLTYGYQSPATPECEQCVLSPFLLECQLCVPETCYTEALTMVTGASPLTQEYMLSYSDE